MEATGEITYPDAPAPPHNDAEPRCDDLALQYLGHRPLDPWGVGYSYIEADSWAAGTRTTLCFVGRWTPDDKLVEVSVSAKA